MKNKIYFFVTLACLLVFGAAYHNFDSGYEARIAAVKKAAEDEKKIAAAHDIEVRAKAFDDRRRVRDQAERLHKEVDAVTAELTKLKEQKALLEQEKSFLTEAVAQVRTNAKSFQDLLLKLESAEAAAAKPPARTASN